MSRDLRGFEAFEADMAEVLFKSDNERWNAVRARDPLADGCFVYCVKTTKIYCRPICKARLAQRSNIEFFTTIVEAMQAGYRACKRCKPELDIYIPEGEQSIFKIQRLLEDLPEGAPLPKLEVLASEAGLTKYHFHRSFKKATGESPREYALSRRRARLFDAGVRPNSGDGSCISTPSLTADSAVLSGAAASPETIQAPLLDLGDWAMDEFDTAFTLDDVPQFAFDTKNTMSLDPMGLPMHGNELLLRHTINLQAAFRSTTAWLKPRMALCWWHSTKRRYVRWSCHLQLLMSLHLYTIRFHFPTSFWFRSSKLSPRSGDKTSRGELLLSLQRWSNQLRPDELVQLANEFER
ncbi:hypothetical protein AC578_8749 [Pseudocercospora eumusae]|uniref:HTH araC/xylS-type domain-containing protein n=1 Tax=Pseudocercospora eumusae TaxID=321146 RepID=A0A139H6B8_9PEZI|nr:hypothetical protein AC578_8749 [Pseudocercospora eumusae]